jgi:hypothetical protein
MARTIPDPTEYINTAGEIPLTKDISPIRSKRHEVRQQQRHGLRHVQHHEGTVCSRRNPPASTTPRTRTAEASMPKIRVGKVAYGHMRDWSRSLPKPFQLNTDSSRLISYYVRRNSLRYKPPAPEVFVPAFARLRHVDRLRQPRWRPTQTFPLDHPSGADHLRSNQTAIDVCDPVHTARCRSAQPFHARGEE